MATVMKQRWELDALDTTGAFVLAPAVDPRFKLLRFLDEEQTETLKSKLIHRMDSFATPSSETDITTGELAAKKQKKETALDILLGPEQETSVAQTSLDELEQYLSEKLASRKTNPINWWKENEHRFPHIAQVARSILNIPSTSTPSERIFSVAGLTVTKLHSCLKPSNVDSLIFLNKNLKFLS